MALPTIVGFGTPFAGIGPGSPGLPAGWAADDIHVLIQETANEDVGVVTGYVDGPDLPAGTGPAGGSGSHSLSVKWRRAVAGDTAPTLFDPADHVEGVIVGVRGCRTTGDPFDVTAQGSSGTTSVTTATIPGDTTTVADCLILAIAAAHTITGFASWANADLANVAEVVDINTAEGNDGSIGVASGEKATAGAFGNTTATVTSSRLSYYAIAFVGAASTPTTDVTVVATLPELTASAQINEVTDTTLVTVGAVLPELVAAASVGAVADVAVSATLPTLVASVSIARPVPTGLAANEIGVMGYSNVGTYIDYYRLISSRDLLTATAHGGYDAQVWGDPGHADYATAWGKLATANAATPFRALWTQWGFRVTWDGTFTIVDFQGWADHIAARLAADYPDLEYWWHSGMETYMTANPGDGDGNDVAGHAFWTTNPGGHVTWLSGGDFHSEMSWATADYVIAQGYADALGPWVNLTDALTDTDDRHPTEGTTPVTGQTHGGDILVEFFEAVLPETVTVGAVLPELTAAVTVEGQADLAIAATLPQLVAETAITAEANLAVDATLPALTAGVSILEADAAVAVTVTATLPQLTAAAAATSSSSVALVATLPALTAAVAVQAGTVSVTVAATLPTLTAAMAVVDPQVHWWTPDPVGYTPNPVAYTRL